MTSDIIKSRMIRCLPDQAFIHCLIFRWCGQSRRTPASLHVKIIHWYWLHILIGIGPTILLRESTVIGSGSHQLHFVLSFCIMKQLSRKLTILKSLLGQRRLILLLGMITGMLTFYAFWVGCRFWGVVMKVCSHKANTLKVRRIWHHWLLMNRSWNQVERPNRLLIWVMLKDFSHLNRWVLIKIIIWLAL